MTNYKLIYSFFLFFLTQTLWSQTYNGVVISAEAENQPIPFAELQFIQLDTIYKANENGTFIITNLAPGKYLIEVTAKDFETKTFTIQLIENFPLTIELYEFHRHLDKVIVSNYGVLQGDNITNIESHKLEDLNGIETSNLGDALNNIPGVTQSGIGNGVKKPVIRGLSSSRIVTYVNNLRIQNQQWGEDHGLPITSLGIGKVEVIKGPASLLYGADALGGVLYFIDEPYAVANTISGYAKTKFDLNSLGSSNELGFKWAKKQLKLNLFAGYDNFADFTIPSGSKILNSRYNQASIKTAIGYQLNKWTLNIRYTYYSGRIGLPGHSHEANPDPTSFQTATQNRTDNAPAQVVQNHFISVDNNFYLGNHTLYLNFGQTLNALKEYEEKITVPDIILQLNNSLINLKWKYKINKAFQLISGGQGMYQNSINGKNAVEYIIPDATTTDIGIYSLLQFEHKKWKFQTGGRIDNRHITTNATFTNFNAFNGNFTGYNYSAGAARITKKTNLRLNIASGFRAPTTSELLSNGPHHGAVRYEIGNENLKIEQGTQIDFSFGIHLNDFEFIVNPFYNQINNFIYLENTNLKEDDLTIYQYNQANFAQLYGADIGIHFHPHIAHWLHFESNLTNVFAEDNQRNPIPMIPQSRINSQIIINPNMASFFKVTAITLQHLYYFKQNRISQNENITNDAHILNFGIQTKFGKNENLSFSTGVRNMLNTTYYNHLSAIKDLGIPNPGINYYFALKYAFNHKLKIK